MWKRIRGEGTGLAAEDLDDLDRALIRKSTNLQVTKRRMIWSAVTGVLVLTGVVTLRAASDKADAFFWICLVLVCGGTYERIMYGQAVLMYKRLVAKLSARSENKGA